MNENKVIVRSKSIVAVNISWWRGNHYNDVANISTFLIDRKKKLSSILMFPFIFRFCESVHLNGMTLIRIKWNRRRKERRNMTKKRVKYRRAYRGIIYMIFLPTLQFEVEYNPISKMMIICHDCYQKCIHIVSQKLIPVWNNLECRPCLLAFSTLIFQSKTHEDFWEQHVFTVKRVEVE